MPQPFFWFLTLVFLRNASQLFLSYPLIWVCLILPNYQIQVMHFCQEDHCRETAFFSEDTARHMIPVCPSIGDASFGIWLKWYLPVHSTIKLLFCSL